ncbi:vacuolar protein sorting-associated protein 16 homolog isoform X2 [Cloeon dipterum]|uniref:vacuolar protein sorting-associated protein 16 homolog isoform X1 n=1 Tax=Cloeon dipterum TaxID=197152 RepID=UPI00321FC8D6
MSAMITAEWCPVGKDNFYRKFDIYQMNWDLKFDNVCVVAAQYGGPVAVIEDRKKHNAVQGLSKPTIFIYSASGQIISTILWNSGSIIELGWSSTEELLCVQSDGIVLSYDLFGNYKHSFSMGDEAKERKVIDAKFFNSFKGTGVVVLTSSFHFYLVNNVLEPKLRRITDMISTKEPPSSWCVLSDERKSRILVAQGKSLMLLEEMSTSAQPICADINSTHTEITGIVSSHDNQCVALFTDTGKLWLGSADLRVKYCEVDTQWRSKPDDFVWCGSEAILVLWNRCSLMLVAKNGEHTTFAINEGMSLCQEMDGVRLLSRYKHEMLQKVPTVTQEVFRINSTEPGSFLLEASRQFQKGSHRSDEYLRLVKDKLKTAVQQCNEAAGYEFSHETQKLLLKAAQFGKSFIESSTENDKFVQMCRTLRVLNAIRDYKVGLPLTLIQFRHLRTGVFLDRLVLRKQYYLAIKIAKFLLIPEEQGESRILALWACNKVGQTHLQDDVVAREIADKLGQAPGISYTEIANKAIDANRSQLALKLMDFEPCAKRQVHLLLRLNEGKAALVKAIDSGNTDLVHIVIQHLKVHMSLSDFLYYIREFPMAQALHLKYCREHNKETWKSIYEQEDDFNSLGACSIREAYEPKNSSTMEMILNSAAEYYKKGKSENYQSLCEEHARLLRQQRAMQEKLNTSNFVGLSVNATLKKLLLMKEHKLAEKLKQEYKIPDRRYHWVKIATLGEQEDWAELERFSKAKKSPIGYEPFVDVCLAHGNKKGAELYVSRVCDDMKVRYYVKLNLFAEAAKVAFEQRNPQALSYVQSKCYETHPDISDKIANMVAQLSSKK